VSAELLAFETRLLYGPVSWVDVFTLPLAITWKGHDSSPGFAADIGVLLLLLAAPGVFWAWKARFGRLALYWYLAWWVIMGTGMLQAPLLMQTRLFLAYLPGLALLAGWGWSGLSRFTFAGVRLGRVLGVLVGLVMILHFNVALREATALNPIPVLIGSEEKQTYLERSLGMYARVMDYLHENEPAAPTLFLWETRSFFAPLATSPDPWIGRWYGLMRQNKTAEEILAEWRGQGFERVLVHAAGVEYEQAERWDYLDSDWATLEALLDRLPVERDFGGVYVLYRLE
jgi:hypothetical protein